MNDTPSTDYLKVGGRLYSLTAVTNEQVDIEAELKQYYNGLYIKHIETFNNGIVTGLTDDWDKQIERLKLHADKKSVKIPEGLINKPVICVDGASVNEIRCIDYCPEVWKMTRYDLGQYIRATRPSTGGTRIYAKKKTASGVEIDLNAYRDDEVLIVKTNASIHFPAMYCLNGRSGKLMCINVNTFHSQGLNICTGGRSGKVFWNNPHFEAVMCQVNHFSLGSRECFMRNMGAGMPEGEHYGIGDFVKLDTIIEVAPEGESQWRT
jgi:hypothetical protein